MNASTSCDKLWHKRLNELSQVWPDFLDGRSTALHKTRVASRRIREALPVVALAAPPTKVKKLSRKMRALTRYLGPIRELDVELGMLEDKSRTEAIPDRAIEMVRREIASRRHILREELAARPPVGDLKKLVKKLERVAKKRGTKRESQWRGVLAARLMQRSKALGLALEDAGPVYAPERVHGVRVASKKLRYALEIAQEMGVAGSAMLVRKLKRHQERLGKLQDMQTLLKHVRETESSPAVASRVSDLAAYAETLEKDCRRLHADFVEHRDGLADIAKEVRHQIVTALTTYQRRQAHASTALPSAVRPRARAKITHGRNGSV
jgi:CHAD domain-containing protein